MRKYTKRLLCFLLFAILGLTSCGGGIGSAGNETVLKIDGENITRSEYMVYLYTATQNFLSAAGEDVWNMDFDGQTADELLEERTISTLQSVIAAKAYAAENGIALTEEQKAESKTAAEDFIAGVSPEDLEKIGIDAEGMAPLMETSFLYSLVYETIAAECEVEPEEMERYYEENREQLRAEYTTLRLNSILLDSAERAEEAAARARAGEGFNALFAEYDVDDTAKDKENGGEITLDQGYLRTVFDVREDWEVGNIVGPIPINGRFFVFEVLERNVPSDETVKAVAEQVYRDAVRAEYVENAMNQAAALQTVEKVEGVWDSLEKFH